MAKNKTLTAQEITEAYDKLELEDRMDIFTHSKLDMEAEKERKERELKQLNELENKGK